jgi:flagellar motor switch/type III secretory pathway protein FliN
MRKELRIQLGRAWLAADDVAALGVGDEIRLDGDEEEPVSICAGARPVGRGTMAVMDGMLCVRIVDVPAAAETAAPAATADSPQCAHV